jgi:hypothetical protein
VHSEARNGRSSPNGHSYRDVPCDDAPWPLAEFVVFLSPPPPPPPPPPAPSPLDDLLERREKTDRSSGASFWLLLPPLPNDLMERREKTDRSSGASFWLPLPPLPDDLAEMREKTDPEDLVERRDDTERSSFAPPPPPSPPPSRAALGTDLAERRGPPTDRLSGLLMYSSSRHLGQCSRRTWRVKRG